MDEIKWDDSLSVGVQEFDEQHKKLIELVNEANRIKDSDKEKLGNVLNELIEFTRVHFSTEEKYFEKYNYPDKESHMEEHANLIVKVLKFKDRLDKEEEIVEEFLEFLADWLKNHLMTCDKNYVEFFRSVGLK
jgi:hemerythrin-like metal-binding protein